MVANLGPRHRRHPRLGGWSFSHIFRDSLRDTGVMDLARRQLILASKRELILETHFGSILDGPITRPHMWLVEAQHPELLTHGPEYSIGPFSPQAIVTMGLDFRPTFSTRGPPPGAVARPLKVELLATSCNDNWNFNTWLPTIYLPMVDISDSVIASGLDAVQ